MNLKRFERIVNILPEVETPTAKPDLKKRLKWTAFALVVFFVLGVIAPIGIAKADMAARAQSLSQLQLILASKIGTLATLGIGPIVMASIILQLLVGAGVIKIDRNNPEDRKLFQGVQKLVAILFCLFEAMIYVSSGFIPAAPGAGLIVMAQIAFSAILIMFLDEIVSKYGIGSGVGLFIAAGVSLEIVWRLFSWVQVGGAFAGHIPALLQGMLTGNIAEAALYPVVFTVIVFLIVVFFESMKVEVPLTFGQIRGYGARYPLKFLYVSNIPVILAAALLANAQLLGAAADNAGMPILGHFNGGRPAYELSIGYLLQAPYNALGTPTNFAQTLSSPIAIANIIVYAAVIMVLCVIFGKFWVQMSNMDAKNVGEQLQHIGLQVPGFRRDPRVMESVLDRYIPMITILGSLSVGALAVFADLTGALGTGTGILLTVGIIYHMYEELASQQAFEAMPALKEFIGA